MSNLLKWHSWLHQDARLTLMKNSTPGRRNPFTLNEGNGKCETANSENATVPTRVTTMTGLMQNQPNDGGERSLDHSVQKRVCQKLIANLVRGLNQTQV